MLIQANHVESLQKILVEVFGAKINVGKSSFSAIIGGTDVDIVIGYKVGMTYSVTCRNLQLLKNLENLWSAAMSSVENASTCTKENADEIRKSVD